MDQSKPDRGFSCNRVFNALLRFLLVPGFACITTSLLAVSPFNERSTFNQRLQIRTNSVLDGRTFREALTRICETNELNLWIDRRVNPSERIEIGPVGPTVFQAIQKIAASQSCDVMPVSGVILVGRPKWIRGLSEHILAAKPNELGSVIDVHWDELTTPSEALSTVESLTATAEPPLPHDHWPKNSWNSIDSGVAKLLIRGQFTESNALTHGEDQRSKKLITRIYSLTATTREKATAKIPELVPGTKLTRSATGLSVQASAAQHLLITSWLLTHQAVEKGADIDGDTFTLKKMSTTAENAFRQLANTAGLRCVIDSSAQAACGEFVTLEGENVTLRFLLERIAEQINATITWQDSKIIISKTVTTEKE